jgi:hypothetical protein
MKSFKIAVFIIFLGFLLSCFYGLTFADEQTSRYILKIWGVIGSLLGIIGISLAGYDAGISYDSYTGWER